MLKYKYQIIIALTAILIGAYIGSSFTGHSKDKEIEKLINKHRQELKLAIEQERTRIHILDNELLKLDKVSKEDSLLIESLNNQVKQDGVRTQQKLKAITKLTLDEKRNWVIDRYSRNSNK